ncbi:MAG TPA: GGDEF domain-containing protein [Candidatus Dormibacteraeota bacterium]|nr:GGDEF domain-containing protein [Candidatus Dormibacteraeota bacterium]
MEAECDELARQNDELFILQQVFSTINSTLELDDILSTVMRGIREALGFGRVVLYDLEDGAVRPRMVNRADGAIVPVERMEPLVPEAAAALPAVAAGEAQLAVGGDPENPYCLVPLVARESVRGVLYVDGSDRGPISDAAVRLLLNFAAQAAMAIETARLFQETKRLAMVDHLTGLANARRLQDQIKQELALAKRHDQALAFVIFDLDGLKRINDTLGHAAGDAALCHFAETLRRTARESDLVARYAGDEFVIVMSQTAEAAGRCAVERILGALADAGIGASAGLAVYPAHAADAQSLFVAADKALYRAKVAGKGRYAVAAPVAAGRKESALG